MRTNVPGGAKVRLPALAAVLVVAVGGANAGLPGKNGMLVFAAQGPASEGPDDGPFDLWSVRPSGASLVNVTQSQADESAGASFSPDGSLLAFARDGDIWVMNPDGSGQTKLVSRGIRPSWSPDGKRIAFEWEGRVEVVRADGSERQTLRTGVGDPSWSPTGRELVVTTRRGRVAVLSADGKVLRDLAAGSNPTWSPDGSRIAFVGSPRGPSVGSAVFLVGRNGKGLVEIARARDVAAYHWGEVAWSPDGTRLAYIQEIGGVVVMKPDGTDRRSVARLRGYGSLDWRRLPPRR